MERKPIKLRREDLLELVERHRQLNAIFDPITGLKLINVRGCNGCGKSTIPLRMLATDRAAFVLTLDGKDVATVFPNYEYVAMGRYRTKTGGLDGFSGNEETKKVLELLLKLPYNILMEGVISSTIFSTYRDMFLDIESREDHTKRTVGVMNLLPPLEVALDRVQRRNGGKEVKEDQIASKWRTVKKNAQKFKEAGLASWEANNMFIDIEDTVDWFLLEVGDHVG